MLRGGVLNATPYSQTQSPTTTERRNKAMVPSAETTAVTITINPTAVKFTILGVLFVAFVVGAPFLVEFMWNSFISYAFGLPVFSYVNAAATVLLCVSVILMIVSTAVIIKELL